MKDYIEKCLKQKVEIKQNIHLYDTLPLRFKGQYELYDINDGNLQWMIVKPKINIHLPQLKKDYRQIISLMNYPIAFYFEKLNTYMRNVFIDENISFIVDSQQLHLPFYGFVMTKQKQRKIEPVYTISYLTQKLILCAIYERWNNMSVTEIAKRLDVSKMSITRCFDELEYLDIDILDITSKTRKICIQDQTKTVFDKVKPYLRNPIIKQYELSDDLNLQYYAGLSALCEYSLLEDNEYPTYAITKKDLQDLNIKSLPKASKGEKVGCLVLELGYYINYQERNILDPISVYLSMQQGMIEDERIDISIESMMEDYVW